MKRSPLTDTCLKRPVTTSMIFLALIVLGVASLLSIPLETYPSLNIPRMSISGSWPDTSPEAVEAFVTAPLEAEASTLRGIEEVTSISNRGSCSISLEFAPDTDMDFTRLELNEKISRLRNDLPSQVNVRVSQYVPPDVRNQTSFLLRYTFTGVFNVNELQRLGEELIERPMMTVAGIADVQVAGGERRQMRVILDENKVESLGLPRQQVASQLQQIRNIVTTVGTVSEGTDQFNLVVRDDFDEIDSLREVIVAKRGERYIRLGEIARIVDGYAKPQGYQRLNGRSRVSITVHAVSGSNIIDVAERAQAKIVEIRETLPPGVQLIEEQDQSETIRNELEGLEFRSIIIIFLIFAVLLIFLRGIANPIIILSSIATSVLLTITIFYFSGASLNMMTLAGLAMGLGMMVDNSIVVLDNIHRHRERGSGRLMASSLGTAQMMLPVLAGTATTIIVFLPFLYLQGELRVLYVPFAMAVVVSLACSLLVSFTLIPSLAARALSTIGGNGKNGGPEASLEDQWAEGELEKEEAAAKSGGTEGAEHTLKLGDNLYQRVLRSMLKHRILVLITVALAFAGSVYVFDRYVTKGRIWDFSGDRTEYLSISISAPTGSDLAVMETLTDQFESKLIPLYEAGQIKDFATSISAQYSSIRISFPEEVERQGFPYLVKDQMSVFASLMGGVRISITGFGDYFATGGFGGTSYSSRISLLGYNYLKVKEIAEDLGERLLRNPRIRDIDTNYSGYSRGQEKQIVIRFDRDALAEYGITSQQMISFVSRFVNTSSGGKVTYGGEDISFLVKVAGFDQRDIIELENAMYTTTSLNRVRLRDVSEISVERVMDRIERKNQQYTRTVAYEFRGPYKMGERARDDIKAAMILPNGYEFDETERVWQSEEDRKQLELVLAFAVLLVYILTSSLYESFFHPFTIILTVPLALLGVFLGYWFFDKGFDQSAYVGVVLMGGIVVNNSIILVDHINHLRSFLPRREAVVRAARERARPIIMTTFTTVIGLMPLLIGASESTDMWYTLAFTICIALPVATFFTLTIIPIVYELIDSLEQRFRRGMGALAVSMRDGVQSPEGEQQQL
ncbi:efflux RND transporter permease subunit [Gemmatimonadota bacterium]